VAVHLRDVVAAAEQTFGGSLKERERHRGLGGMGGAQAPLAITMTDAVALIAQWEEWRIDKLWRPRYLDNKVRQTRARLALEAGRKVGLSPSSLCNAVPLLKDDRNVTASRHPAPPDLRADPLTRLLAA